jgi:putative two-component system response regulator
MLTDETHQRSEQAVILIVDDEAELRTLLREVAVQAGYRCIDASGADEALEKLADTPVDVVVTDIRMPGMSGTDLLHKVKERYDSDVIVLTGYASDYSYEAIIEDGAVDFVRKPCSTREFIMRVRRVLTQRRVRQERDRASGDLERTLTELREAYLDTIQRLSIATEYKDVDTGMHIVRMGRMSAMLAEWMGLAPRVVNDIRYAAPIHDVGKIGIPDSILLKAGRLTSAEFEIMKTHTTIGGDILANPKSSILACAREIALAHHECWDGSGYPLGLSGESIPPVGRIVKLVDVFDALVSSRPYKSPYLVDVAVEIVRTERGTHFAPDLLDLFVKRIDELLEARKSAGDVELPSREEMVWSERDNALRMGL